MHVLIQLFKKKRKHLSVKYLLYTFYFIVICAETKIKEEKKNFLRLEKLLYIANSAVIQKIEKKILSDTNLDVTSLETGKDFLNALSKDQKDDIYSTAGIMCFLETIKQMDKFY